MAKLSRVVEKASFVGLVALMAHYAATVGTFDARHWARGGRTLDANKGEWLALALLRSMPYCRGNFGITGWLIDCQAELAQHVLLQRRVSDSANIEFLNGCEVAEVRFISNYQCCGGQSANQLLQYVVSGGADCFREISQYFTIGARRRFPRKYSAELLSVCEI